MEAMFLSGDKWLSKFSEYVIYIFLATFPFVNYRSFLYFGSSTRSINIILIASVLIALLGVFLLNKRNSLSLPKSPIIVSIIVYLLFVTVSAIQGVDFRTSFYSNVTRTTGLWYMICLGIFIAFLINLFKDEIKRRVGIIIVIASTALFSVLSVLGPEGFGWLFKGSQADGFTLGNSTFAGMYVFGSFILSLYFLFSEKIKSWWKILLPFLIIFNPYIFNITGGEGKGLLSFVGESRASAVALFGSILVLVFIYFTSKLKTKKTKKIIAYSLFSLTLIAFCWGAFSLFSKDGVLRKIYLSQATSARLLVWEMSDGLIRQKPIFGWGTENFEKTFELNYDSRALQNEYGAEPWFDRAHNIFIDQALDNGLLGLVLYLLIYVVTGFSMLYVVFNSKRDEDRKLAIFLLVYTVFHLIELQTAFDTSISYVLIAVMITLATIVFKNTQEDNNHKSEIKVKSYIKYSIAIPFLLFGLWSLFHNAIPFLKSGVVNGRIRTVGSAEKRIPMYETLFNTPVDLQALLWRTSTDFERGISQNTKVLEDPAKVEWLKKELYLFEEEYTKYIEKNPNNFRAMLNLADIKIYFMLFGVNKLEEAHTVLDKAIELVPTAPQPLWMKSVAYLYMRKFDLARLYAKKAYDLNPKVPNSVALIKYIDDSIRTFPEIGLYFFKQI